MVDVETGEVVSRSAVTVRPGDDRDRVARRMAAALVGGGRVLEAAPTPRRRRVRRVPPARTRRTARIPP